MIKILDTQNFFTFFYFEGMSSVFSSKIKASEQSHLSGTWEKYCLWGGNLIVISDNTNIMSHSSYDEDRIIENA